MSERQCPRCHCVNDSMTEVAGDLHCLACGYVADVPMEAWDECEAQKDARIAALEAELAQANTFIELLKGMVEQLEGDEFEEYDLQDLMRRIAVSGQPRDGEAV